MEQQDIRNLLEQVARGEASVDAAMLQLKEQPFQDLGYESWTITGR